LAAEDAAGKALKARMGAALRMEIRHFPNEYNHLRHFEVSNRSCSATPQSSISSEALAASQRYASREVTESY